MPPTVSSRWRRTSSGDRRRGAISPYTDEGRTKARALWAELDTDQFARDLGDIVAFLRARPDCTGKVGVMGFCLGGKFAYLASTRLPIDAAVSYYGVHIDQHLDEAGKRGCPILMQFASDDPHVPEATVAAIRARMDGEAGVDIPRLSGHGAWLQPPGLSALQRSRGRRGAPPHGGSPARLPGLTANTVSALSPASTHQRPPADQSDDARDRDADADVHLGIVRARSRPAGSAPRR